MAQLQVLLTPLKGAECVEGINQRLVAIVGKGELAIESAEHALRAPAGQEEAISALTEMMEHAPPTLEGVTELVTNSVQYLNAITEMTVRGAQLELMAQKFGPVLEHLTQLIKAAKEAEGPLTVQIATDQLRREVEKATRLKTALDVDSPFKGAALDQVKEEMARLGQEAGNVIGSAIRASVLVELIPLRDSLGKAKAIVQLKTVNEKLVRMVDRLPQGIPQHVGLRPFWISFRQLWTQKMIAALALPQGADLVYSIVTLRHKLREEGILAPIRERVERQRAPLSLDLEGMWQYIADLTVIGHLSGEVDDKILRVSNALIEKRDKTWLTRLEGALETGPLGKLLEPEALSDLLGSVRAAQQLGS